VLQETAIRLIDGEGSTVHIESFDFVTVRTAAEILGWNLLNLQEPKESRKNRRCQITEHGKALKNRDIHGENRSMFVDAQRS